MLWEPMTGSRRRSRDAERDGPSGEGLDYCAVRLTRKVRPTQTVRPRRSLVPSAQRRRPWISADGSLWLLLWSEGLADLVALDRSAELVGRIELPDVVERVLDILEEPVDLTLDLIDAGLDPFPAAQ